MIVLHVVSAMPQVLASSDFKKLGQCLGKLLKTRGERTVGIRFVPRSTIQKMNRLYRKQNKPTDVLSFSPASFPKGPAGEQLMGDVVICPSYAHRQARERDIPWREELLRLLAHGVLHLAGFDHATKKQERHMFSLQERCVADVLRKV